MNRIFKALILFVIANPLLAVVGNEGGHGGDPIIDELKGLRGWVVRQWDYSPRVQQEKFSLTDDEYRAVYRVMLDARFVKKSEVQLVEVEADGKTVRLKDLLPKPIDEMFVIQGEAKVAINLSLAGQHFVIVDEPKFMALDGFRGRKRALVAHELYCLMGLETTGDNRHSSAFIDFPEKDERESPYLKLMQKGRGHLVRILAADLGKAVDPQANSFQVVQAAYDRGHMPSLSSVDYRITESEFLNGDSQKNLLYGEAVNAVHPDSHTVAWSSFFKNRWGVFPMGRPDLIPEKKPRVSAQMKLDVSQGLSPSTSDDAWVQSFGKVSKVYFREYETSNKSHRFLITKSVCQKSEGCRPVIVNTGKIVPTGTVMIVGVYLLSGNNPAKLMTVAAAYEELREKEKQNEKKKPKAGEFVQDTNGTVTAPDGLIWHPPIRVAGSSQILKMTYKQAMICCNGPHTPAWPKSCPFGAKGTRLPSEDDFLSLAMQLGSGSPSKSYDPSPVPDLYGNVFWTSYFKVTMSDPPVDYGDYAGPAPFFLDIFTSQPIVNFKSFNGSTGMIPWVTRVEGDSKLAVRCVEN